MNVAAGSAAAHSTQGPMPPTMRPLARFRRPVALAMLLLLAGCAAHFPADRIPKTRWLIMPMEQPPTLQRDTRFIQGFWFFARTVRQNPRAAEMLADTLSRRLAPLDCVNLFSQIDLKYYFADKRQRLEAAYPWLEAERIHELMYGVPPRQYGLELDADKILGGRIIRHYMAENRLVHWWWSVLEVRAQVIDVRTGEIEWEKDYYARDHFGSMSAVQEQIATELVEDLKRDYFLPMAVE